MISDLIERFLRLLRDILESLGVLCDIAWQPNALAPVFYGARDYAPPTAPWLVRVFFPSLDGAVWSAPILELCGRYPLIVFLHGHCAETGHHEKWFELPATLARAGYVVAVPHLPQTAAGTHPSNADADLALVAGVLDWMRNDWEHRRTLLPAGRTGIAGHSYGALLAGRFAAERGGIAAYASLSGVWDDWSTFPRPIDGLAIPKLLTWGSGGADLFAPFGNWAALPAPKHRAEFAGLAHWDYLPAGRTTCAGPRGPCPAVPAIAIDLVTMFFGRYLAPQRVTDLNSRIPPSLVPPPLSLTTEQQFYAGAYLTGFAQRPPIACRVTLGWDTGGPGGTGTAVLP